MLIQDRMPDISARLAPFVLSLGFTPHTFAELHPEVQELIMGRVQLLYNQTRTRTPHQEYRLQETIVNAHIGDRLLRHVYIRKRQREVTAEYFIGEVLELLTGLVEKYPNRIFHNYVFYFSTEENQLYPISLAQADVHRLGVEGCLKQLVEMDHRRQHELYNNGSDSNVLGFLQNRRLYTRMVSVSSRLPEEDTVDSDPDTTGPSYLAISHRPISKATSVRYIGFDFETVIDPKLNTVVPYAVSLIIYNSDQVECKRVLVISHKPRKIKEAVHKVIRAEKSTGPTDMVYLVGFNNSNFDNFLLQEIIQEYSISHEEPFISKGALLGMTVEGIIVKDLRRFVMASLKTACKDFGCVQVKGELAHHKVQMEHYAGNLKGFLHTNQAAIKSYVEQDVVSMMELWFKCKKAYRKITDLHIEDHMTLAGVTYAAFRKTIPDTIWENRPLFAADDEKFVRQATYGGRSQVFKPMTHIKRRLAQGDIKSLYPHLMKMGVYPIGPHEYTTRYRRGKVGVYRVKIIRQPEICIVPYRDDTGLDWDHREPFEAHVTNVSLELLDEHGGEYTVMEGYYWSSSTHVFDDYITRLYKLKQRQDRYKTEKNSRYNPSLRNIVKLLMNSLSGKMVQRTYTQMVRMIETPAQLKDFETRTKEDTREFIPHGSILYARGEIKEIYIHRHVPIMWGILIYEYSRSYMYNKVYSKMPTIATETDSYTTLRKHALEHQRKYPEMYGDEMGQLEVDYLDEVVHGIFVAKKCMCLYCPTDRSIIKATFKGVNITADKVITRDEYNALTTDEAKYHYYWDDEHGSPVDVDTYEKMAKGEQVLVLCSQLVHRIRPQEEIKSSTYVKQIFQLKRYPRDS